MKTQLNFILYFIEQTKDGEARNEANRLYGEIKKQLQNLIRESSEGTKNPFLQLKSGYSTANYNILSGKKGEIKRIVDVYFDEDVMKQNVKLHLRTILCKRHPDVFGIGNEGSNRLDFVVCKAFELDL